MAQPIAEQIELEENIDADYEPSEDEIKEYYECLEMDWDKDQDLRWIAIEALKAPLPKGWKPCEDTASGDIYYFNFKTGESVWEHPMDEHYRKVAQEERKKKQNANSKLPAASAFRPKTSHGPSNGQDINSNAPRSRRESNVVDFEQLMAEQDDEDEDEPELNIALSPRGSKGRVTGAMDADLEDDNSFDISASDRNNSTGDVFAGVAEQNRFARSDSSNSNNALSKGAASLATKQQMSNDNTAAIEEHARILKQKLETEKARLDREHQHSLKQHKDELNAKLMDAKANATAEAEKELELLKQTSSKRKQLEADLKQLQNEHDERVKLLDEARAALDEDKAVLKKDRAAHEKAVAELQDAQSKQIAEMKQKHNQALAEIEKEHEQVMKDKQAQQTKEMEQLKTEQAALKDQLTADTKNLEAQLKQQKETLSKEHAATLKQAREEIVATHEKAVAALKDQLEKMHSAEFEELNDQLDTARAKQEAIAKLNSEIEAAKKEKAADLQHRLDQLESQHDRVVKQKEAEHQRRLEGLEAETERKQREVEEQIQADGEARVKDIHAEIQTLVDACDEERAAKTAELETLRAEHEEQVKALEEQVSELDSRREELSQQVDDLSRSVQQLQEQVEAKEAALDQLEADVAAKQAELDEAIEEVGRAEEGASQARRKAEEAVTQPTLVEQSQAQQSNQSGSRNSVGSQLSEQSRAERAAAAPESKQALQPKLADSARAAHEAVLEAVQASLQRPPPSQSIPAASAKPSDAISEALQSLVQDTTKPQPEETRDTATLSRAKRFLDSQRSSLHTRHADLQQLRQTLDTPEVQQLSNDEIVERLKMYVSSEQATLHQQEASLDASLRFLSERPSTSRRLPPAPHPTAAGSSYIPAQPVSTAARFQDTYLSTLSATRPVSAADAAAPVDRRVADLLDYARYPASSRHSASLGLSATTMPAHLNSTDALKSNSLRTLPSQPSYRAASSSVGQRDFLAEHRRWLSSYRQEMASFDAAHNTSLSNAAAFRPKGPMQIRLDASGIQVQNKATIVP
eukprot:TRINITY_DN11017_c0_g2_i1.p1 TRINITY_DN11017_c0_g2~~TRINITY_DN11017_c0_g2_i1.p1  ORF type:complete len:1096 (+),score=271.54 TRINITY_DN11017_c0_g2_i1:179-3289(+)